MELLRLVYSPDDNRANGKGWYWEETGGDWRTSQAFESDAEAKMAKLRCQLVFGDKATTNADVFGDIRCLSE